MTTKTSKLQSHISQQNIVQNEQFAYFSCKNENIYGTIKKKPMKMEDGIKTEIVLEMCFFKV